jgi:16S rRNA C967 or C1407 C5-methylase (RsmB/RsmF family)/NOL1/NOP2/fmu family ribosome biogenesis protein
MKTETKYPEAFLERMRNILKEEYDAFIESMEQPSPTSVRVNPFKRISKFDEEEKVEWCETGRYLKERPSFTFDPLFHAGCYYVQEASSMFIEQAWKQINPDNKTVRVLDMCAAPGGKSTHLLSLMTKESLLVSNELISNRNNALQQNIVKWGTANCIVTQNDPKDFARLEEFFDIILVDAPCSGEGLFRKDKNAIDEWSENNVAMCTPRQKEILQHAITCLKPGGFIIYSTCTFEPSENDEQLAKNGLKIIPLDLQNFGLSKTTYGHQAFPHKIKGEGFYIAVLQKPNEETLQVPITKYKEQSTNDKQQTTNNKQLILQQYLIEAEGFQPYTKGEFIFAIPKYFYPEFQLMEKHLYIRHAGIFMGTMKGKDFLPSHDLALCNHVKQDLPSVELSYEEAISYLRAEAPKIKSELRGWCLAKYENRNLGWMKLLEGRINNYFPKELRILKES